jgi:hypothetical protein
MTASDDLVSRVTPPRHVALEKESEVPTEPVTPSDEPVPAGHADHEPTRRERWSARVFSAAAVAAGPLLLWFGRDHWFFLDEWWVLTRDGLTSPGYLDGHNGHWITLLRFDYRLNFELWGLRSYLPYQVPVVLAHVGAAVLVRLVTRRLGVRGWIATAIALAFLFFGSGRENMTFGFQFSLTASLVCGLALFLLAEGPRTVTRRDGVGLALGLLGLMTSSVFPALLVGIVATTLLRRGARVAAFYAVPLAAVHTAWYARYGRDGAAPLQATVRALRFAGHMLWSVFDALAHGGVGAVLVAVAAVGLGAAVLRARQARSSAELALPLGLAVSWAAFAALTAMARAGVPLTSHSYDAGRYLHIGAALLLPLVAAGAQELARRHLLFGVAALLPLAIGLPHNLDRLSHTERIFRATPPQYLFATAHSPFVDEVPPNTRLPRVGDFEVPLTAGWLARQADTGRVPAPDGADPGRDLTATSWLVLAQVNGSSDGSTCPRLTGPLALTLDVRDRIDFAGAVNVTVTDGRHESQPRSFSSRDGSVIRVLAGPVDVVVRPVIVEPSRACSPPPAGGG